MTDDITPTDLSVRDRGNILGALKALAALESSKLPREFSQARLDELHELSTRLGKAL